MGATSGAGAAVPRSARSTLVARVRRREVAADPLVRPPRPSDAPAIAELMLAAYRGTIDDDGETPEETLDWVQRMFAGEFGAMLWNISEVTERAGRIVAATLCTVWAGRPFVALTVTAPEHKGQGLARAGLTRAINRLAAAGDPVLRLVLTPGNTPAERLYTSLGFVREAP
jgi:ribosomal protein S18 acetylase RimI-like enzyme